jgi:preprotein translocase subunit SecY
MKAKDIRDRVFWLFAGFFIFALAVHIPITGINHETWEALLNKGELFQLLGMFTGGALNKFSIAAMGITPYINASIIMQLLTVVWPQLKELQKEGGEMGRKKISQYTRCLTVGLAFLQATMMTVSLSHFKDSIFMTRNPAYLISVILTLVGGTCFLIWLGETISEKALGNGVSLLIFAGIVMSYPTYMARTMAQAQAGGARSVLALVIFFAVCIGIIVSIIWMTMGYRKVPVQYPKRQVGNKVYGGQSTYIPIQVNNAGVMSIIFAISIMYLPATVAGFISPDTPSHALKAIKDTIQMVFNPAASWYNLLYFLFVVFFTFFYSAIALNIEDMADNLKKAGGFIPGIRPGRSTQDYMERLVNRLTLVSAIYLGLLAVIPTILMRATGVTTFQVGATSLLIIVGVALDTMQQIQARVVMREYQGFMK